MESGSTSAAWTKVDFGRHAVEHVLRNGDELGKGPMAAVIVAGDPQHAAVVAKIDFAAAAMPAAAAVDRRVEGHAVAGGPIADLGPDVDDRPRRLVAHDDRRLPPAGAAVHAVDVAAADAAGRDAQQDLVRGDLGARPVLDFQMVVGGENEGFHGAARDGDALTQGMARLSGVTWSHGDGGPLPGPSIVIDIARLGCENEPHVAGPAVQAVRIPLG